MGRMEHAPFLQAGDYLRRAIELEPEYATAYAWYAYWHIFLVGQAWAGDARSVMKEAGELAERAIVLDPFDARGLTIAGHVRAFLHRRLREAASLHERALSLNPNLSMAWALSAITAAYMGEVEDAERRISRYKKLSPLDPYAFIFDGFFTVIHLLKRDFECAVVAGRTVTQMNPSLSAGFKPYLAALGHIGRDQEAAIARARLLALEPDFTVERFMETTAFERVSDRELFANGLRLAGVPESDEESVQLRRRVPHDAG
jgi:tetratricopeptide (TPR) repeat protein